MKTPSTYVNIALMACCVLLLGCTDETPVDPVQDDNPYEQWYWIMTEPNWPEGTIAGTYAQTSNGSGYMVDPDSLRWEGRPWPVRIKRNGEEVWMRTPGNAHTFRGVETASEITGYMIAEGPNGRPGPITYMTLRRVQ